MSWRRLFTRGRRDADVAQEIEAHLTLEADELIARGVAPAEARAAAVRKFGNPVRVREQIYELNSIAPLDTWWQDVRYGLRLLLRDRGFAGAAILSLALGVGANAAMFQLLDAVRLRALPVAAPDRLVEIRLPPGTSRTGSVNGRRPMWTYSQIQALRARQRAFSGLAVWGTHRFNTARSGEMQFLEGLLVNGGFFGTLGVGAFRGRVFSEVDDQHGCAPAALISHAYWHRAFGGDESVLSKALLLEGVSFPIVGVTPPSFFGVDVGRQFDVAVPICAETLLWPQSSRLDRRDAWWLGALGRLADGYTVERASAHLDALSKGLFAATLPANYLQDDIDNYLRMRIIAVPAPGGVSGLRNTFTTPLVMLLGLTALVLLIACANLANLLLARATVRERELAVRLAIGASRGRVLRQLLIESALLAGAGAAAGLVVGLLLTRSLVAVLAQGYDGLFVDLAWNARLMLFTAGVAVLTCLLFGVAPAFRATALAPASALKAGGRLGTGNAQGARLRRGLVVLQVALSLVLLVGAILFSRTLSNLLTDDPGFRYDNVLLAFVSHLPAREPGPAAQAARQALRARLADLPEAEAAVVADVAPLSGSLWNENVRVEGRPEPSGSRVANFNRVSPGFFRAVHVPLLAGRDFAESDTLASPPVAIVSQAFTRRFIVDGAPIGHRVRVDTPPGEPEQVYEIVGVAGDLKVQELREPIEPMVYLSSWQERDPGPAAQFVLTPRGTMDALRAAVTRTLRESEPASLVRLTRLRDEVRGSLVTELLTASLSVAFGALAAVLAGIGLFGVLSYNVARRAGEIGVRLALGAARVDVLTMVLVEAGRLLALGMLVGLALGAAGARFTSSLLYRLEPWDPWTFAGAAAVLAAVGLLAGYLPAIRAARVDPVTVLRAD